MTTTTTYRMILLPVAGTTTRVSCGQCAEGWLKATHGSFQSDLICDRECGHRVNMVDILPEPNERVAFDGQGYLIVTEYDNAYATPDGSRVLTQDECDALGLDTRDL